jgi:LytS/YehU family sensor histidine kinase
LGFEYTENFAKVYRYLLLSSKKQLITLHEELKFLEAYLFLLENRIGSGVAFEINVPDSKRQLQIPPVTLQLLVENAIKYNRIEKENPLKVKIYVTETDELVVYNNLLPLLKNPHSSGIGLANIFSRYALLSDKVPRVEQNESSFTVKIPLIQ